MMVFDPSRDVDFLIDFAESRGATITHTFETHLQADYISGSPSLLERGVTFVAHESDYGLSEYDYHALQDGEEFGFSKGGPKVLANHSPGHTPGSTSYVVDEKFLISGDTVFIVSVGRPDLGRQVVEWAKTLYSTLKTRISILPDHLLVLPGHFTDWQIEADEKLRIINDFGTVKRLNEEIYNIDDELEFVEYIQAHMREQPEIYAQIRLVNAGKLHPCPDESNVMDLGKNECAANSVSQGQNA
jgi:glyoxylase-like metal-dependent hydrolase (beta-lactamase superfamily II)